MFIRSTNWLNIDTQGLGETFGRVTIEAMAFGVPVSIQLGFHPSLLSPIFWLMLIVVIRSYFLTHRFQKIKSIWVIAVTWSISFCSLALKRTEKWKVIAATLHISIIFCMLCIINDIWHCSLNSQPVLLSEMLLACIKGKHTNAVVFI